MKLLIIFMFILNAIAEPIVVTAKKLHQDSSESTSNFESVNFESNPDSIYEQILNISSITKSTNGAKGSSTSLKFRMLSEKYTLILIDGIPVIDPSTIENSFDLSLLNTDQIESIEILKGSNAALYGVGGAASILSIKTKKNYLNNLKFRQKFIVNDLNDSQYVSSYQSSKVHIDLFENHFDSLSSVRNGTEKDSNSIRGGSISLNYDFGTNSNILIKNSYSNLITEFDTSYPKLKDAKHFSKKYINKKSLIYTNFNPSGDLSFIYDKQINNNRTHYDFNLKNNIEGESEFLELSKKFKLNDQINLGFGINQLKETYIQNDKTSKINLSQVTSGINQISIFQLNKKIIFDYSIRLEKHSTLNNYIPYSLGLNYKFFPNFIFKTTYSEANKNPSLYQLHAPKNLAIGFNGGNQKLNRESIKNTNISLEYLNTLFRLEFIKYFYVLDNKIEYIDNTYKNRSNLNHYDGHEVTLSKNKMKFSYIKNNFKDEEENIIYRTPSEKYIFNLNQKHEKHYFDFSYIINSSRKDLVNNKEKKLHPYALADMSYNYSLNREFKFIGKINNIFDQTYEEVFGYSTQKRRFYFGIESLF